MDARPSATSSTAPSFADEGVYPPPIISFPQGDVDGELLSLFVMASGPDTPPGYSEPVPWPETAPSSMTSAEPSPALLPRPPVDATSKGAARLARKAELARASRLRKKTYVSNLEASVANLKAAVEELQTRLAKRYPKFPGSSQSPPAPVPESSSSPAIINDEPRKVRRKMSSSSSPGVPVDSSLDPPARQRLSAVLHALDMADLCLAPPLQVKFALWSLDQPDAFYDRPGLWLSLLQTEIGMSPEQMETLRSRRMSVRAERRNLAHASLMMKEIRDCAVDFVQVLHRETSRIQALLLPDQIARLHAWVKSTDWSIDVLPDQYEVPTRQDG
ncbi:BZIP domain-containing protein [Plasmodiophora brassicae]|uniref:BZIP domain-containing protein n=1 Tax=Plasmodiophora brassicae TaxID=37360 RepID=A0A0G4ISR1_PLABS|nr:hypothetical protein PBRA_006245 [Plasmodiophora brassicae]